MTESRRTPRWGRRLLRRQRPPARRRPAIAAITVVRDEKQMLPRWIDYYGSQLGLDSLIVVDDNSTDGSTEGLDCTVHRIPPFRGGAFNRPRSRLVSGIAEGLLATYDGVLFTDVDEFVIADPARYDGLRHFFRANSSLDVVAPIALNVLHQPQAEGRLRARRPIIGQRQYAKLAPVMCKPSLKRVPAEWCFASHGIRAPYAVHPELFMLHMKFADRQRLSSVARHRHALVQSLGRGRRSSWAHSEELFATLEEISATVDLSTVPEFDPASVELADLVTQRGPRWRSRNEGQILSLRKHPLVRIPERLHGVV